MTMTFEQLAIEAKSLPLDARLDLIDALVESIPARRAPLSEEAQRAVIRRRLDEIRANPDATIPGDEVFAELERVLGK
jgi:putative addiction module component (TIGR02574 family)